MRNDIRFLRSRVNIIILLLTALFTTSCWRENLDSCWMDDVTLIYTAEKFQEAADGVSAPVLGDVVDYFDYYLFRIEDVDMQLVDSGRILKSVYGHSDNYELNFNRLPFGNYIISSVGNNPKGFLNVTDTSSIKLKYIDGLKNNYYIGQKQFTVDCYCNYTDFVKLYNSLGKLEIRLYALRKNIVRVKVSVDNLYDEVSSDTIYSGNMILDRESDTEGTELSNELKMDLFSFPTVHNVKSNVVITLYMQTYGQGIVEAAQYRIPNITILRNQTLRIEENFHNSLLLNPAFSITINPDWDGVTDNGNTDL